MKNVLFILLFLLSFHGFAQGQQDSSWQKHYRESYPRTNNLVHTKLDARFDYQKSQLNGKVWLTLKPFAYSTDSLVLDAKGMDIHKVQIKKGTQAAPLTYVNTGWFLKIKLDKVYKPGEAYTVMVDYTARPDDLKIEGSAAITDAKGLYFINPRGEDKNKPTQIWTQGETEGTSVWCPIIDKPNQKSTTEITMTVPAKYVTLSNGKLISQIKNTDGTRTDTWKMDLPHSPYLFFMGVGDYAVIKDTYRGMEVSYYVEKEYASTARRIFGLTPEMIRYFEKVTRVKYPWVKYSQIVGRDYVSGAMENTTATLHQESAQQDARQLLDGNTWETVIAHELFHQWFGDYVTAESWSNLTVNESFADYSQYLWKEYKYGADEAQEENYTEMLAYLGSPADYDKDLVRFYYPDREAMFDLVSYQKGGRVLNMLRNFVGDSAFFKGLNLYLTTNKFKAGEAHQLRLALEETSGKDLNWFFNQWYFGNSHPTVTIDYAYDEALKRVSVNIKQKQGRNHLFKLPVSVDIYNGPTKVRHDIWITKEEETFVFAYSSKPDLVNVDAQKIMLWNKTDNKTLDNYIHQYNFAGNYVDRREAVNACLRSLREPNAIELVKKALKDKFYGIQLVTLEKIDINSEVLMKAVEPILLDLAKTAGKRTVRAGAIDVLGAYGKKEYKDLFIASLKDSSYSVAGAALTGLAALDSVAALAEAKRQMGLTTKSKLADAVTNVLLAHGTEADIDFIARKFTEAPLSSEKFIQTGSFCDFLAKAKDPEHVKHGVDAIVDFRNGIPSAYRPETDPAIDGLLTDLMDKKEKAGLKEQAQYIKSKLPW